MRLCPTCQSPNHRTAAAIYCSDLCRSRAQYEAKKADGRYEAAKTRARETYIPRERAPRPTRQCEIPECDGIHAAKGLCKKHYKQRVRASDEYRPSPSDKWSPARKTNWRKRKAKIRGAQRVETVDYQWILLRDRYICQLCMQPIDRNLHYMDPLAASVDHRIPLKAGGNHTRDNLQAAHRRCNQRKGSKLTPSNLRTNALGGRASAP